MGESACDGLISDVRLVGVTTKGVNVEVMVLEQSEVTSADGDTRADSNH